ncbi:hypothetical protein [Pontibacter arcticus]|uniref:TonB protein C-terminal n=1 Tax=Pontibacter arcticus TaxID=2080288 RepID=A0A364RDS9_9BACT|nr:hypothetical protein [Pontibacter arcticus]RAU82442.1 hypothetical protein DP923_11700 [Pontibacter arcticus]
MNLKTCFLIFTLTLFFNTCFAQISLQDLNSLHNAASYTGSKNELIEVFSKNVRYPKAAFSAKKISTIIGVLKISRSGDIIETGALNKADEVFVNEFNRVAKTTKGKWKVTNDSAEHFYAVIPIQFNLHEAGYDLSTEKMPSFFQDVVVITAVGASGAFQQLYEKKEGALAMKVNELVQKEAYTEAIIPMTELFNLQPFHTGYYEPLISLLNKAGKSTDYEYYLRLKNMLRN